MSPTHARTDGLMAGKTITGRADKSGSRLACKGLGDRSANGLKGSNRLESLEPRTMKFVHQIGFLEATLGSLEGCWVWRRLPSLLNRVAVDGLGGCRAGRQACAGQK